jgi:HK97 family phage prohead protease
MATGTIKAPPQFRDGGFHVRANSYEEETRTIDVIWTTGEKVRRYDWRDGGYYDEELVVEPGSVRLERLNRGAPFLNTHDSYDLRAVLGSVVPNSARVGNGEGTAKVKLTRAPDVASEVQKIIEGDVRNISVGYRLHKIEKTEGDTGDVALWRVVDWEPFEISAVPIPADAGAQVRSGKGEKLVEPDLNECLFLQRDTPEAAAARMRMRAAQHGLRSR